MAWGYTYNGGGAKQLHHFGVIERDIQVTVVVRLLECTISVCISFANTDEGQ